MARLEVLVGIEVGSNWASGEFSLGGVGKRGKADAVGTRNLMENRFAAQVGEGPRRPTLAFAFLGMGGSAILRGGQRITLFRSPLGCGRLRRSISTRRRRGREGRKGIQVGEWVVGTAHPTGNDAERGEEKRN